ncbi:hypothetical protein F5Y00DRAFT_228160 [Daldinia vernicosa]|uniref:uncharacterized protein n=1 Tax=Daldinia vernicosa TaxID=114800 RepID=UPI002007D517|nr:uncharacterized protein F5Y00DRAFT_228160 [Daldinia vernicosa]KAI0851891.1 hypothetical protein F5Y00DRAFT_228160 [Daldinia vernicosa]
MHFSSALAALLFAVRGISTPIQPSGSAIDLSNVSDGAYEDMVAGAIPYSLAPPPYDPPSVGPRNWPPNDPIDNNSYCRRDTVPGTNLTEEEKEPVTQCFNDMVQAGEWVPEWTLCNGTSRYFTAWGLWWKNPDDCYNECKRCFVGAIMGDAANWYCYQSAGFMAQCTIRYMQ